MRAFASAGISAAWLPTSTWAAWFGRANSNCSGVRFQFPVSVPPFLSPTRVLESRERAGIDHVLAYQHAAGADAGAVGDSHGRMNQYCRLPSMGPDPVRKTSSRDAVSDGDNGLE